MKKTLSFIFVCAAVLIGMTACETLSCPLNNIVESNYGFYQSQRDSVTGVFNGGLQVQLMDTLTIVAFGSDSILLNRKVGASSVQLPVSYYHDEDTLLFFVTFVSGHIGVDTLWLAKTNLTHFDEPSCPASVYHEITGVRNSRNFLDTVIINNKSINYDGLENLQIYFK